MKIYSQLSEIPLRAKVALYGAGEVGVAFCRLLQQKREDVEVLFFVDSYKSGEVCEIEVLSPAECAKRQYDEVIITSFAFSQQISELLDTHDIVPFSSISPVFDSDAGSTTLLYAFYDRAVSPDGFDIIGFLALAEAERVRMGLDGIHVVVVPPPHDHFLKPGEDSEAFDEPDERLRDQAASQWYEQNILLPCCWMLPSCKGVTRSSSRDESQAIFHHVATNVFPQVYTVEQPIPCYSWIKVVDVSRKSYFSLPLRATRKGLHYVQRWLDAHLPDKKVVTITVRESIYHQDRNSQFDEWVHFAHMIEAQGYLPLWVRDTEVSMEPPPGELDGQMIFKEVPWNLELRMALYELAYLNMFTGSGPSVMANYNQEVRLVRFELTRSEHFGCSSEHMAEEGLPVGSQLPGSGDFQRTVWAEEKRDRLYLEFTRMVEQIERSG